MLKVLKKYKKKNQNSPSSSRYVKDIWKFINYDSKTKSMYCDFCLKSQTNNSFTSHCNGCSVLKKESITTPVKTKG